MVMATVESARRLLSKPVQKKEPITPHHLYKFAKKFGGPQTSLLNQRVLTICAIGFAGFFRYSELVNTERCDIIFLKSYLKLFVEQSKTETVRGF